MARVSHLIIRIIDAVSFQGRTQTWFLPYHIAPAHKKSTLFGGTVLGHGTRFILLGQAHTLFFSANFALSRRNSGRAFANVSLFDK
jgi:hypothetical protein